MLHFDGIGRRSHRTIGARIDPDLQAVTSVTISAIVYQQPILSTSIG